MNVKSNHLLLKVLILSASLFSIFLSETPANPGKAATQNERIGESNVAKWADDLFLSHLQRDRYVGGIISVVKDGDIVFEKGYGYANYFRQIRADAKDTAFRSGSTSKVFTAIAIMQEVEKETIELDENINTYLTRNSIDQPHGEVTIRDFLTHTAAFEERFRATLMEHPESETASADYLGTHEHNQIGKSGERIQYSNYGMGTLGVILEDVTGLTFREYLERNIFHPLGMKDTYVATPEGLPFAEVAHEHQLHDGKVSRQQFYYKAPAYLGSGGLFYTAHDMAIFMNAVLDNSQSILNEKSWHEMKRTQESQNPYTGVGYGFWIYERGQNNADKYWNGVTRIGHSGGTQTFRSKMMLFPKDNMGIFVGTVGSANRTYKGQPAFNPHLVIDDFIQTFRGTKEYSTKPADSKNIEQLTGNYYKTRRAWTGSEAYRDALIYENLTVGLDKGQLYISGFGALNFFPSKKYTLNQLSKRTYLIEGKEELISFSEDGKMLTKGIYNNYDKVPFYKTPKSLALLLLGLILILLGSVFSPLIYRRGNHLSFEISAAPASVIAIGTTLFPFLVFGIIGIHYRLESSVFLFHNVLAWLTLVMTIWLSYLYLSDVRSSLKEETLRLLHRTVLLVTLWILNYIFIALDVIRIVEA
jgi:CubicO group peptidase (beta-lactamase class C family)